MSFEPILVIRREDLIIKKAELEREADGDDEEGAKVAQFLLDSLNNRSTIVGGIDLIVVQPEFSSFNSDVRDMLAYLNVEFGMSY